MIHIRNLGLFLLFFFLVPFSCSKAAVTDQKRIQEPAISGSWYPDKKEELEKEVKSLFDRAKPEKIDGDIIALIEPHAGYKYSGIGAARGYKLLKGKNYKRVIILAPSHYSWFDGVSTLNATHYRTPLGLIPIDREVCDKLLKEPHFKLVPEAYKKEHSLEIQLPLLQQSLKDFKLVPLIVGEVNGDEFKKIAMSIKKFVDNETLLVASSDFTHYGFNFGYVPFKKDIKQNLKKLDNGAIEKILKLDFNGFMKYQDSTGITVCGRRPIAILLEILPEKTRGTLVSYYTSGDLLGDYTSSVSYTTIAFSAPSGKMDTQTISEGDLDKSEKETLLKLARATLEEYLTGIRLNKEFLKSLNLTPKLRENRGVFITIKKHGDLRGCIGYIEAIKPLHEAVEENTINACSRDYRFPPMIRDEVKEVKLEISVMSPLKVLNKPEDIIIGKHGLVIQKGFNKGIFLPQVATEYGWDRETFLTNLCRKADLLDDAWREGSTIWTFTAQVFGEE